MLRCKGSSADPFACPMTRAGWPLFPLVEKPVLRRFASLPHVGIDRLMTIQTP
jgi:hypothetical protein